MQRVVPGPVLATEGGLPLRLQHAEPEAMTSASGRGRAQPRALRPLAGGRGAARAGAERAPRARATATGCAQIFKDVPVIYGFPSKAPLGPVGGPAARALLPVRRPRAKSAAAAPSARAARRCSRRSSMTVGHRLDRRRRRMAALPAATSATSPTTGSSPRAEARLRPSRCCGATWPRCACSSTTSRSYVATRSTSRERQAPDVARRSKRSPRDDAARARYLAFARDADERVGARADDRRRRSGWAG